MQTVRFDYVGIGYHGISYLCDHDSDQSGEYVPAAVAERLLAACKAAAGLDSAIDQAAWYASSQIPSVFKRLAAAIAAADQAPVPEDNNPNPAR